MSNLINILMLISFSANAGDFREKGYVLPESSIIFSIEEANSMRSVILKNENEIAKLNSIIKLKDDLLGLTEKKIELTENLVEVKKKESELYSEWVDLNQKRINNLSTYRKIDKVEKYGFFIIGATAAYGSIILADKLNDNIVKN